MSDNKLVEEIGELPELKGVCRPYFIGIQYCIHLIDNILENKDKYPEYKSHVEERLDLLNYYIEVLNNKVKEDINE